MADAKKCDICKEYYGPYGVKNSVYVPNTVMLVSINKYDPPYNFKTYDCCPNCMETVQGLIKALSAGKEEEEDVKETNSIPNS